ncbi:Hemerythrin HHE cation binding domain protein [Acididesulfobacillus acetoxydans]|uniref:Hemerythrin HHE cation binding domain protein n=1 Tax=Acididesulfobacillus acetoxydans TaxID=1561005 RepID=A0A8S0WLN5_9FIRM|nr:DUF438 domain-containing protein [Acididesulfobacillus acetoxydans]CAA7600094.1 Hemerythrin HHE cation binding domain protein [Acididesulfobacillus acetoxydans]CEJ07662.1 Hemerythrin HHE cation binding domain protein [Acididesulfobacillus acetoxydans]
MSEAINNRVYRQRVLKELITDLHQGSSVEEVKNRFAALIEGVSASEIAEMEQALILEGMPVEEVQRLCDVHASVFKGSIEEIHAPRPREENPAHPIYTFKLENRELEKLLNEHILPHLEELKTADSVAKRKELAADFTLLGEIDKHYSRKENLLFPYMEKHKITAPPQVMWGVDDEIRILIKETRKLLADVPENAATVIEKASQAATRLKEMIFKEENILFPMASDSLTDPEWMKIAQASPEIGYCLIDPPMPEAASTSAHADHEPEFREETSQTTYVHFDAGLLLPEEINAMLNTLPIDITFVDKNNTVKYFTQGKERIFARPKTIIGRLVENCHPPASVHIVQKIVEDLKSGKKDHEDFWLNMGNQYVYIRYFAVRNAQGEYLGTMEVSQDIRPIQEISGEKRLMADA